MTRIRVAWLALAVGIFAAAPAVGKNIFDDDWTPSVPAAKPQPAPASEPPPAPEPPAQPAPPAPSSQPAPQPVPLPPARSGPASLPSARPAGGAGAEAAPSANARPARRGIPAKGDQDKSRKLFREVFAKDLADRSIPARHALAQRLLKEAGLAADAPTDQFVLLMGAMDAAREGADLPTSFRAISDMASTFEVDALRLKSEVAATLTAKAPSPVAAVENCRTGIELVGPLLEQESYATAARVVAALRPAAAGDAAPTAQLQALGRRIESLRTAAAAVARDREKLKAAPNDPAASLAVGRFLCFHKEDWQQGLPLLANGSDAALKSVAAAELAQPNDSPKQSALGDAWWDLATREANAAIKRAERQRAAFWYEKAIPGLASPLSKKQAEMRIAEVHKSDPPVGGSVARAGTPAKTIQVRAEPRWVPSDFSVVEGKCYQFAARGQWTDTLGAACGPDGVCPRASLTPLGPQPWFPVQESGKWYLGQYARGALIAQIGDEKRPIFVGASSTVLAPASGKLSFRIHDGDDNATARTGQVEVSVTEIEPRWVAADGSVSIYALIDEMDMLHVTPEGLYWEYGGRFARVGEHQGHYPTLVNGIQWWPKWIDKTHTEPLKAKLTGRVQLDRVDAKRGSVKLEQGSPTDTILRFSDKGGGASQVGCVIRLGKG